MDRMEEALNNLSDDEVELLNSDPEMLAEFKQKYSSPEKKSFVDKLRSISPELVNPVNAIPFVAASKLGSAALEKSQEGYDLMGDMANEELSKRGHTVLGPTIGGTIQNIPNVVNAAAALSGVGGSLASEIKAGGALAPVKSLGKDTAQIVSKAFSPVKNTWNTAKEVVTGKSLNEAEVEGQRMIHEYQANPKAADVVSQEGNMKLKALQDKLTELKNNKLNVRTDADSQMKALEEAQKKSGRAMGEIEEKAGVGLNETLPPVGDTEGFINTMGKIKDMTPSQINEAMSVEGVQTLRKQAQILAKDKSIPTEYRALIQKGRESLAKAVERKLGDDYASARSAWQAADDELSSIPESIRVKSKDIGVQINKLQNESKSAEADLKALVKQAKSDDIGRLNKVKAEIDKIKEAAARRERIISNLKTGAVVAASTVGLGSATKWVLGK